MIDRFSERYEQYQKSFGPYIEGTDLEEQIEGLKEYVEALKKLTKKQRKAAFECGVSYVKEKKKAYRTGKAEVILFFELFYKCPQEKIIQAAIKPKDFPKFSDNPGTNNLETRRAHDEWWDLMDFKHRIVKDYFFLKEVSKSFEKLWNKLDESDQEKIEEFSKRINSKGSSDYKYEEVKVYLTVCHTHSEISSAEKRRDYSLKFLSKEAKKRLENTPPSTLSTSWEKKLREEFYAQE